MLRGKWGSNADGLVRMLAQLCRECVCALCFFVSGTQCVSVCLLTRRCPLSPLPNLGEDRHTFLNLTRLVHPSQAVHSVASEPGSVHTMLDRKIRSGQTAIIVQSVSLHRDGSEYEFSAKSMKKGIRVARFTAPCFVMGCG